ncbi:MAG: hypothetical protein IT327_06215 [Anaerolineae bacterium]|nr:hypothetical protein [Anaerolineae bacterium]
MSEAGFDRITVKLPYNLVGTEKHEIELQEFIERERNYPSIILSAISTERDESIKVLFVNISRKAHFFDDTFPSGHSEPSEIFVQSRDPARVFSLVGFFGDYFGKKGQKRKSGVSLILYFLALFFFVAQFLSLIGNGTGFLSASNQTFQYSIYLDVFFTIVALIVIFSSYKTPTGLYVNPPPKSNVVTLAKRALHGQVMDNPLVSLIVTVVAALITALILKLLNLL